MMQKLWRDKNNTSFVFMAMAAFQMDLPPQNDWPKMAAKVWSRPVDWLWLRISVDAGSCFRNSSRWLVHFTNSVPTTKLRPIYEQEKQKKFANHTFKVLHKLKSALIFYIKF